MATYTIEVDTRTKKGKAMAKIIENYVNDLEQEYLVKKTAEAVASRNRETIPYSSDLFKKEFLNEYQD